MNSNVILWRDWGDYLQSKSGDVFEFVMRVKACDFKMALNFINVEMGINLVTHVKLLQSGNLPNKTVPKKRNLDREKLVKTIEIEKQNFTKEDIQYWAQYGISLQTLIKFHVSSVKHVWINNMLVRTYSRSYPVYSYMFQDYSPGVVDKYKIYSPMSDKKGKWLTNASEHIFQGENEIRWERDTIIITKSLKDIMVLNQLGYEAIAPQSETTKISSKFIEDLSMFFSKVIIFYDNDKPGIDAASKLSRDNSIPMMYIPEEYNTKDISDFMKEHGELQTLLIMDAMIETAKICKDTS
jgi:5S rRNA maturation endonuclease (ribonuclease M5)